MVYNTTRPGTTGNIIMINDKYKYIYICLFELYNKKKPRHLNYQGITNEI